MSYEDISKVFAHVFELPHLRNGVIQNLIPIMIWHNLGLDFGKAKIFKNMI